MSAWFAPVAVVVGAASALVTFLVLTGLTPIVPTHNVVVTVLLANAVTGLLLLLVGGVGRSSGSSGRGARQGGGAAACAHRALFALVAVVPAILVAVIASITLDRGLDRWFS